MCTKYKPRQIVLNEKNEAFKPCKLFLVFAFNVNELKSCPIPKIGLIWDPRGYLKSYWVWSTIKMLPSVFKWLCVKGDIFQSWHSGLHTVTICVFQLQGKISHLTLVNWDLMQNFQPCTIFYKSACLLGLWKIEGAVCWKTEGVELWEGKKRSRFLFHQLCTECCTYNCHVWSMNCTKKTRFPMTTANMLIIFCLLFPLMLLRFIMCSTPHDLSIFPSTHCAFIRPLIITDENKQEEAHVAQLYRSFPLYD